MKIIAFGHRKRVGKDTACRFLSSHIRLTQSGSNIRILGFADKLKEIANQLYYWAGLHDGEFYEIPKNEYLKDTMLPALGKSPREIWIQIGCRIRDYVYHDTWVDYLLHTANYGVLIIKDMRFPNEANAILRKGGHVFRIDRPDIKHTPDEADDPLENYQHWTEVIKNDGSLADLNKKIINLVEKYKLNTNIFEFKGD